MNIELNTLQQQLSGDLHYDNMMRALYATDASVYRELPLAVALPKNSNDIKELIKFANEKNISLIPRAAGTSLAGQCVGGGIVALLPNHFCVATWSPGLNEKGNSKLGMLALEQLTTETGLSIF